MPSACYFTTEWTVVSAWRAASPGDHRGGRKCRPPEALGASQHDRKRPGAAVSSRCQRIGTIVVRRTQLHVWRGHSSARCVGLRVTWPPHRCWGWLRQSWRSCRAHGRPGGPGVAARAGLRVTISTGRNALGVPFLRTKPAVTYGDRHGRPRRAMRKRSGCRIRAGPDGLTAGGAGMPSTNPAAPWGWCWSDGTPGTARSRQAVALAGHRLAGRRPQGRSGALARCGQRHPHRQVAASLRTGGRRAAKRSCASWYSQMSPCYRSACARADRTRGRPILVLAGKHPSSMTTSPSTVLHIAGIRRVDGGPTSCRAAGVGRLGQPSMSARLPAWGCRWCLQAENGGAANGCHSVASSA